MKRKIVHIHEDKCNGCGLCVKACHEGAIELINGKAKLISDEYCDGLGDCLPECPTDAIEIIEREAKEYDDELVKQKIAERKANEEAKKSLIPDMPCGCPGSAAKLIQRQPKAMKPKALPMIMAENLNSTLNSELRQWPVQLKLVNSKAPYLNGANLLVAADCTAYAYKNFHEDFIKDHITVIGCPKLDDNKYYEEKLADMLKNNDIKSITVVRMEVPCCGGIVSAVKNAMLKSEIIVPYREVIISTDGNVL
ncbi:MAG: ferredoxin [Clostridium lundense]|nr:ferredoxin [Clostridium lundense]